MPSNRSVFLLSAFLGLSILIAPAVSAQEIQYQVTINTSSQLANMGYIDLQFNPSILPGTAPANADVTNYFSDGVLNPAAAGNGTTGDVSGMLPLTVSFDNGTTLNEYTEGMTFGTTITFDLILSGQAISNPPNNGTSTTFAIDFLNSDESAYLFTNDPNGDTANGFLVGYVTINADGTTTTTENPSAGGGPSVITFSGPTVVPEPASIALLCGGLLALAFFGRRLLLKQKIRVPHL